MLLSKNIDNIQCSEHANSSPLILYLYFNLLSELKGYKKCNEPEQNLRVSCELLSAQKHGGGTESTRHCWSCYTCFYSSCYGSNLSVIMEKLLEETGTTK